MAEEAIKQQIRRASKAVIDKFMQMQYQIIPSENSIFCFLAVRKNEIRMIRVTIGSICDKDIQELESFQPPTVCSKEIWCRRNNGKFEIKEVI